MEKRPFGTTGLEVSVLTFGCGAVGGLMTKGEAADQDRAVAWARDNGINHFDTAPLYGNTVSERNLGRALGKNRDGVFVSTKVLLGANDLGDPAVVIRASIEASLRRLKQDHVDIFQLHNVLGGNGLAVEQVLDAVLPAFETLRDEGKARFLGFTANGDTDACHALILSGRFNSAQVFFNILAPSAGESLPAGYPAQDYREMLHVARDHGVGSIGVRVLAGGALSGREDRHPLGMPKVDPIGSGDDYATDVRRALAFQSLVDDGVADSLPELAVRYAISHPALPTTEVGIATLDELQQAANAVNKGSLPDAALARIRAIQAGFCT
jgi:L-galactose dehydrogenase/L-glyceraldehyde 3-phosphate reductase